MFYLKVFTCILLSMWIYFIWIRRKYYGLIFQIPGPLGIPLVGMSHKLRRAEEILPIFGEAFQKYGSVFFSWLGPFPFLVVSNPQIAEDILTSPHCVDKALIYDAIDNGIGKGLFSIKNPHWSKHRKLLNPAFNNRVLQSFMPIFNTETNQLLQTLALQIGKNDVNLMKIMQAFTLRVAINTTMGKSLPMEYNLERNSLLNSYECALRMMSDMCFSPWLIFRAFRLLLGRESEYCRAKNAIKKLITTLLNDELNTINDPSDVHVKQEKNIFIKIAVDLLRRGDFTWQNVVDESNVIVSGAFETTSNTITYTLMLLAMHPKYQQKAYEEIATIFNESGEFDVTYANLQEMIYMDLILNEVMRLIAPVPIVARQTTNEVKLSNNVLLPKGVQIAIDIFHMHRSTEIWGADADIFNPERFFKSNMQDKHSYAFIPFTKGIRNCIGWRYALMSVKTTLAKLLRNYHFTTTFNYSDLCYVEDITIKLKKMPLFELHKRE